MNPLDLFSPSYEVARRRFRDAARAAGATVEQHRVDTGEAGVDLTIDVATVGSRKPSRTVVVSSGVHGVEGFFGSAIQLAWLSCQTAGAPPPVDGAVVLVHAVNPYGFARLRRTNEHNVDLNRNFLDSDKAYAGAPDGYAALDPFLNPASPPSPFEPYRLKALWQIGRHGLPALKAAGAGGQYRFPRGLFFGGHGPTPATQIMRQRLAGWLGGAPRAVCIDLHSGLGSYGQYRLLLEESPQSPNVDWYRDTFGPAVVEAASGGVGTAYEASGTLGGWAMRSLGGARCRFVNAEFGTHPLVRVLGALRAENRAHFFGRPGTAAHRRATAELLECFCPRSDRWRALVVEQGLAIITQAICSH
ncbi:MAG: M14 family metallopeptidase [Vicinamibacterales bacterium]